ncbi:hypothetical protein QQP08_016680 [Theobroma cacao]|nr:hypothetical protein QQP08_016680 [Theobroma cacao]
MLDAVLESLSTSVPSTEIFYSLNATIVGLAVSSEESESLPWCVGLGIVRGIDMFKGLLYMITPVPQSTLEKVNLLLQGSRDADHLMYLQMFCLQANRIVLLT